MISSSHSSIDNNNTKRFYKNYSLYRYEEVEAKWLSSPTVPPKTLCWVLQSKGKKGRGGKEKRHRSSNEQGKSDTTTTISIACASESQTSRKNDGQSGVNDLEGTATETSTTTDGGKQRKELLSRARVIGPKEKKSDDITPTITNDNDDDDNKSPSKKKQKQERRILVRYPKGSTYHVKRENLLPVLTTPTLVMVLPETRIYHRWTVVHTQADDCFCEIGCDVGVLVHRVWTHSDPQRRQHVWGVDKGPESIALAKQRYPECQSQFRLWSVPLAAFSDDCDANNDTNKTKGTVKEEKEQPATLSSTATAKPPLPMDLFPNDVNSSLVVAIDINGNRELQAVRQCMQIVIQEWKPRLIIVKSRALYADLYQA